VCFPALSFHPMLAFLVLISFTSAAPNQEEDEKVAYTHAQEEFHKFPEKNRAIQSRRRELLRRHEAGEIDADGFAEEDAKLRQEIQALQDAPIAEQIRERALKQMRMIRLMITGTVVILLLSFVLALLNRKVFKRFHRKRSDDIPHGF
jgi:hypothetical protein